MLFYYAVAAANDNNWLHAWFSEAIATCMDAIDAAAPLPTWDALTTGQAEVLRNRPAVRGDFIALVESYSAASAAERITVRTALQNQFDVAQACATGICLRASDLPGPVAEAAVAFGERLFELLGPL